MALQRSCCNSEWGKIHRDGCPHNLAPAYRPTADSETVESGSELLPCPFCGGKARAWELDGTAVVIGCPTAGCVLWLAEDFVFTHRMVGRAYEDFDFARTTWNTRAQARESRLREALSECEKMLCRFEDIWLGGSDDETVIEDLDTLRRKVTRLLNPPTEAVAMMFDEVASADKALGE